MCENCVERSKHGLQTRASNTGLKHGVFACQASVSTMKRGKCSGGAYDSKKRKVVYKDCRTLEFPVRDHYTFPPLRIESWELLELLHTLRNSFANNFLAFLPAEIADLLVEFTHSSPWSKESPSLFTPFLCGDISSSTAGMGLRFHRDMPAARRSVWISDMGRRVRLISQAECYFIYYFCAGLNNCFMCKSVQHKADLRPAFGLHSHSSLSPDFRHLVRRYIELPVGPFHLCTDCMCAIIRWVGADDRLILYPC